MNNHVLSDNLTSTSLRQLLAKIRGHKINRVLGRVTSAVICAALIASVAETYGQAPLLPSVNNQNQVPIPGTGHDYQHLLGETVNLSNGSVSFKLSFPISKERGTTQPYSWTYNSSTVNPLDSEFGSPGNPMWDNTAIHVWPMKEGWNLSEGIPWATAQVWSVTGNGIDQFTGYVDTADTWIPCNFQSGMTFTGMDGVTHNLNISATAPAYINNGGGYVYTCPGGSAQMTQPPKGDGQVIATLSPLTGLQYLAQNNPTSGDFTVVDKNGTSYTCGAGFSPQSEGVYIPCSITDRNGNVVGEGTLGRNGPIVSGEPGSSGTSTVSVLVSSGKDSNGSVVGGQLFNSTWTTTSVNYTANSQRAPDADPSIGCTAFPPTVSGTRSVLSSLTLPNGKSYQFFYGSSNPNDSTLSNPFGLLNEVIFPDGGWIKYRWALPASGQFNEYAEFSGTEEKTAGNGLEPVPQPFGCVWEYQTPTLSERDVSFDGTTVAQVQTFAYTTSPWTADGWTQKTTNVTTTDKVRNLTSETDYVYTPYLVPNQPDASSVVAPAIPLESSITYYDWGSASKLKTVKKQWLDQFDLASEMTTVYGANGTTRTAGTIYKYETSLCTQQSYQFKFQEPTSQYPNAALIKTSPVDSLVYLAEEDDYDFGNGGLGPLAKKTLYNYQCFASPFPGQVPEPAIPPQVSKVTVEDGAGHIVEATQYGFDGNSLTTASALAHNDAGYGTGTTVRANLTAVTRCSPLPSTPASACSGSTTQYSFDTAGQPISMTDPNGNSATFSFSDSWNGNNVTPTDTATSSGNTDAYMTAITYADGLQKTFTYDLLTGYLTTATDENQQQTKYLYNTNPLCTSTVDGMYRLGEVDYPDGGNAQYCYNDAAHTVTKNNLLDLSQPSMSTIDTFDGMGHTVMSELASDPDGATFTATAYDGEGNVSYVTNPYRGSSSYATYQYYDALGRTVETKEQDGNVLLWCFDGLGSPGSPATANCNAQLGSLSSSGRPGTWVDFTDERGQAWQRTSDVFGNLTEVMEPNGSSAIPSMETDYSYDTMNNLVSVQQYGGAKGGSSVARSFSYDPLSRLIASFNPETGTIGYTYDADGNLKTRTDARQIVTTYGYDDRNRLLSKTYSNDPSGTPASCYLYGTDQTKNAAGRLIYSWTQSSQSCGTTAPSSGYFSLRYIPGYDAMGRIPGDQQNTLATLASGSKYSPSYVYNLAGMVKQWGDGVTKTASGSLLQFTNSIGAAGRVQTVSSTWADATHPQILFAQGNPANTCQNSIPGQYSAAGALMNAEFGSGLMFNRTFDPRLRVNCELDQGTGTTPATPGAATVTITGQEQTK